MSDDERFCGQEKINKKLYKLSDSIPKQAGKWLDETVGDLGEQC